MDTVTAQKNRFVIFLIIFGIVFIILDRFGIISPIQNTVDTLTLPIQKQFNAYTTQIFSAGETILKIDEYKSLYEKLKAENLSLNEKVLELEKLKSENELLRKQLKLDVAKNSDLIEANVIGFSDINSPEEILIDVGSSKGVKKGDVVVWGNYAVGLVSELKNNTSKVELISSRNSILSVSNSSGSARGTLKKDSSNNLVMGLILPDEKISEKDQIITNNLNSPYPKGLLIGEVKSVSKSLNNFNWEAQIEGFLDFSKLNKVFIIDSK